jgi:hypothetical protein
LPSEVITSVSSSSDIGISFQVSYVLLLVLTVDRSICTS